jgi:hypothetical protein
VVHAFARALNDEDARSAKWPSARPVETSGPRR